MGKPEIDKKTKLKLREIYRKISKKTLRINSRKKADSDDSMKKTYPDFVEDKIINIYEIDTHVLDDISEFFNERIDEIENLLRDQFSHGINLRSIKINKEYEILDGWHRLFMLIFMNVIFNHKENIKVKIYQ